MLRRLVLTLLLLGPVSSVNLAADGGKTFHAERFDVRAELAPDRSLRVDEEVVFVFEGGDFTSAWREIPARRTDGLVDVGARMDGVALAEGTGPGQVEIRRRSSVRVTWHFPATRGRHVFSLTYRMLGVAAQGMRHDELAWIALPDDHGYAIETARVWLTVPAGAGLPSTASVRPVGAEVLAGPDGVSVLKRNLPKDATIRVDLGVASSALTPAPPRWQAAELERTRRGPWLLLVAGAALVAGLGWLAAFRAGWSGPGRVGPDAGVTTVPPDPTVPAAVAARLASQGTTLQRVTATLVELADRGVVRFEEHPRASRMLGRGYELELLAHPSSPAPHEAAALAIVFGAGARPGARASWRRAQQNVNNKGLRFGRALVDTMRRYGYVDPERVAARRTLVRALVFVILLFTASVAVAAVLIPSFGGWGFAIPVALALVTIAYGIAVARFSVLSGRGDTAAHAWRRFLQHVHASTQKGSAATLLPAWLPLAVGIGVGHRALERMGRMPVPQWFHAAASGGDGTEAFTALLETAGASSYGAAGASAGAGGAAAGGGSSGAA